MNPDAQADWPIPEPYDFFGTTKLLRTGGYDPTLRREPDGLWRTTHTPDGPATVHLRVDDRIYGAAWGPGATHVLGDIPAWLGLNQAPWTLPPHPVTDRLLKEHPGLRSTDTRNVFEALVVTVLGQLVSWEEAAMNWRRLCERLGEPAPGPTDLLMCPTPPVLRRVGTDELQAAGIGLKRARTLTEVARVAHALEKAADLPTPDADALLQKVRGVGPWTAAFVLGGRLGRPDPMPVGDFHMPNTVAWALAREPRGTDERMVELLEAFPGQAFQVVRLLSAGKIRAPRFGPKRPRRRRF